MDAKHKIHRYEYQWGGQRKQWWKRAASMTAVLLISAAVGWFAYDPVAQFIMGLPEEVTAPVPNTSQQTEIVPEKPALPESQAVAPESQAVAPETIVPEVKGLPERIYYLTEGVLNDSTRLKTELEKIKAAGGTGAAFDLKNENGMVLYKSELPEVTTNLAQSETAYDLSKTVEIIKAAGLTPVGRIFAFKDSISTSATAMSDSAVKYMDSKVNWLDNAKANGGKSWLNPNNRKAQDYILKLVEETTAKGINCLILDGVQFPTGFSLHLATFGGTPDRSGVLADFLTEATKRHGAAVYPVISLDAMVGANNIPYGPNPEKLAAAAGGVLVDVRPEQFGIGITTDKLTLSKPVLTPYDTVKTALAAATATTGQENLLMGAMVQCYTSPNVEGDANKPYGKAETEEQVKAVTETGIGSVFYYNPQGNAGTE